MFLTVEEMRAEGLVVSATTEACGGTETMAAVIALLDAEVAEGAAASSRERAKTAIVRLLALKGATPATTELSLAWFDAEFPYNGWNPVGMPSLTQATYRDYRRRSRAAIERTIGSAQARRALRSRHDGWADLEWLLRYLPLGKRHRDSLIPLTSTLPRRARERALQPTDITSDVLKQLHDAAPNSERKSLRNAARQIRALQADPATREDIRDFFPSDIEIIHVGPRRSLGLPQHFLDEIEEMVEHASRRCFVEIKEAWDRNAPGTQVNHRVILRRITASLIATGGLSRTASAARPAFEDQEAMRVALTHLYRQAVTRKLAWSTVTMTATHLPAILERNGIELPSLRGMIADVKEFKRGRHTAEMDEGTKAFCRALVERQAMLADFGTAHLPLRTEADRIMAGARRDRRSLTSLERARVRALGTVALFCAIQTGGPSAVDRRGMLTP